MSDVVDISDLDLADKVTIGKEMTWGGFSSISHGILLVDDTEIEVAVKSLRVHGNNDSLDARERIRKRFYREVILWRRLRHANIVPLLGYIILSNESPTLISPWYTNSNITKYLTLNPNSDRRALTLDVVNGLAYLHSIPVAHGDLKGENVLVDADGHASLCDFGMSQFIDEASQITGFTTTNGNMGGTDRFLCPELLEDQPKTIATDMWALGCLVVQILTDIIPYGHITRRSAVISAIMRGEPPMENSNGEIESSLWICIRKCWSIEKDDRPNASELGAHLALPKEFESTTHITLQEVPTYASPKRLTCIANDYSDPKIVLSHDAKYLAVAGSNDVVGIWELGKDILSFVKKFTPKQSSNIDMHVRKISWSTSHHHLLVQTRKYTKVFVVKTDELLVERGYCRWAGFLPDSDSVAFLEQTGEISIQHPSRAQNTPSEMLLGLPTNDIEDVSFSPDNHHVAVVTKGGLKVYSMDQRRTNPKAVAFLQSSTTSRRISISHDGSSILVSSTKRDPELWEMHLSSSRKSITSLSLRHQYKSTGSLFQSVQFGGMRDEFILGVLQNKYIHIWDRKTADVIHSFAALGPHFAPIRDFSVVWNSRDDKDLLLVVATWSRNTSEGDLQIWSVPPLAD